MDSETATIAPNRPTGGKAQRTFDRLAAATLAEICEKGGFTADAVARRAGSSPATFFSYFPSKDAALAAAFSLALDELVVVAEQGLRIDDLLDRGVEPVCADFVEDVVAYFTRYALAFRAALVQLPQSKSIRDSFRDRQAQVLAHYARFIELGQKSGFVRQGNTETMANALMVMTQGLNQPAPNHPQEERFARRTRAEFGVPLVAGTSADRLTHCIQLVFIQLRLFTKTRRGATCSVIAQSLTFLAAGLGNLIKGKFSV